MDARVLHADRPIYVDLDGTLIKTDLLWESLFLLARQSPGSLWQVPLWAARGKACLKAEIAKRVQLDPSLLPYREEVVHELRMAKASGRRVILATGANERFAHAIAEHLGLFDGVMASCDDVNLTASRKLDRIVAAQDVDGFEYFGNSHEDVCLLEAAREATVVAPDRLAGKWQRRTGAQLVPAPAHGILKGCLKAMRLHQWAKNVLVFVPVVLTHEFLDLAMVVHGLIAFFAFSFAASSVYILNDLLDLTADRRHKTKRRRPFASGQVPIPVGLLLGAGLLAASFGLAATLPFPFGWVLGGYMVATTLYSFFLKRMLLIDVLMLAALYTTRIVAGSAAADVEASFWLMAFSVFFFLSLALVKRFTELLEFGAGAERQQTGRGYLDVDLDMLGQAGIASGFASVLVLALYIDSAEVRQLYDMPWLLWPLCPLVLYIVTRIWILARRNQMHEDPVVFILHDWRSQMMIAAGVALFGVAAVV
ncbi:prenyltransferase [Aureimonas sp. Leaf454]|uniref:UbiA family prenyltransferase n=1 Tax=Aureimonas sp. Leaf454 TaxID=1736381 RepID=UPI0006F26650|nr:UbiA family prenyltransferase [Aureimonas sp. Leaf454]KQT54149.1 prenyltransferase [Aureimonas sp. Leaf454]